MRKIKYFISWADARETDISIKSALHLHNTKSAALKEAKAAAKKYNRNYAVFSAEEVIRKVAVAER